jgi:hypothetical protein
MKKCSYCGAEYPDDAAVCPVDQTPFASPTEVSWSCPKGLRPVLRYGAPIFIVVLLYFLSFGVVRHFTGTIVAQKFVHTDNGTLLAVKVQYPKWVSVVYYPAFAILPGFGAPRPEISSFTNHPPNTALEPTATAP